MPGSPVTIAYTPPVIAWTVEIPAAPVVSPILTEDRVIVAHLPGVVAAYARRDGRPVWRVSLNPERPLATDGSLVFVVAADAIHALRAGDGSVAWRSSSPPITAPLVVKEGWLIASGEAGPTARRAGDGSIVWTQAGAAQREAAAIGGDVLFIPVAGGRVVARELGDGRVKWERQLGGEAGEPFVLGDDVFVGASKIFYCLDAVSGEVDWQRRVGASVRGRAASDGYRVFFAALDNMVHSVDRSQGAVRWQHAVPFRPTIGPFVAGSSIFVAGPDVEVRVLRARDGSDAGRIRFPGQQAVPPGFLDTPAGSVLAAVTGTLSESWSLTLTLPFPVTPASR